MGPLRHSFWLVLLFHAIGVPGLSAQQQPQQQQQGEQPQDQGTPPIPAARVPVLGTVAGGDAEDSVAQQELVPDDHSLVGAENLSLGAPKTEHSFWRPFVDVSSTFDSNPLLSSTTATTSWNSWTSVSGGVDLHRIAGTSSLVLSYLGAGSVSNEGSNVAAVTQQLGVTERLTWHRSVISLIDQVGYVPVAGYGYAQPGVSTVGVGSSSLGSAGLQPGFTPEQSILTTFGQSISNTSLRSKWTRSSLQGHP